MDTEAAIGFFVTCISRLSVSASDYIDCILDAVSQAAAVKQSADETVEQVHSVGPLAIEGLICAYYEELTRTCYPLKGEP